MKKINLEIEIEINDNEKSINIINSRMMDLEDKLHSLQFKTLETFNELNKTTDISQEEKFKSKLNKASDWVEKESNLDNQNKDFVSKWINKDLPFYFFQCNNAVEITNNLIVDQDIESFEDEHTNNISGFSVRSLAGDVSIEYDFNKLSLFFDKIVDSFQKHHGFAVPQEVLSIIDIKESVDNLNKIDFDKDKILNFLELDSDDNVSINLENIESTPESISKFIADKNKSNIPKLK
jgi:hypothetical protein